MLTLLNAEHNYEQILSRALHTIHATDVIYLRRFYCDFFGLCFITTEDCRLCDGMKLLV